jgi:hypothetical protein
LHPYLIWNLDYNRTSNLILASTFEGLLCVNLWTQWLIQSILLNSHTLWGRKCYYPYLQLRNILARLAHFSRLFLVIMKLVILLTYSEVSPCYYIPCVYIWSGKIKTCWSLVNNIFCPSKFGQGCDLKLLLHNFYHITNIIKLCLAKISNFSIGARDDFMLKWQHQKSFNVL